jgi:Tfp pilus assembly protein PilO
VEIKVPFNWKKKQVLICAVAVMLVVDFVWFGCLPLRKTMKSIKQTKTSLRLAIEKGIAGGRQLPMLKEQLQKLQQDASKFELNVPGQRDLGEFLQQLADLMTENNLREQSVAPQDETRAEGLGYIPIKIQCKGKLARIFEFYKRLQTLDRLVRVEQVNLANDSSFSGEVSMETKVVIFYRPEADSVRSSRLPNEQEIREISSGAEPDRILLDESKKI